jgi:hypothetical protein
MQELLVDFITHWTATGPRRARPDGGDSKDPSISPGGVRVA